MKLLYILLLLFFYLFYRVIKKSILNYIKNEDPEDHVAVNISYRLDNEEEDTVYTRRRKSKPPELSKETIKRLISLIEEDRNEFIALDVETANRDRSSICQIGLVGYENGEIVLTESILVNPEVEFESKNISIHGISERKVRNELTFIQLYTSLKNLMENRIIAIYTPFDKTAFNAACNKYNLEPIECIWYDVTIAVRRTWDQYSNSGYGLSNIASYLGIEFDHHNAVEDARASGEILLQAIEESGDSLYQFVRYSNLSRKYKLPITREGNPDGTLYGERIVFTGSLTIPRGKAAGMAAKAGGTIANTITKKTTILVVGQQDHESLKYKKANHWISKGVSIRIINENDFLHLVS